jgi:tRNA-dihydrouridine synthase
VRTARKHIIWYTRRLAGGEEFCDRMIRIDDPDAQAAAVDDFLQEHGRRHGGMRERDSPAH